MACYFTSDIHINHKSINKYRTRFNSAEEHHQFMIDKILSLTKRDTLYILGDFIFDGDNYESYMEQIRQIKAKLKIVLGNHDSKNLYRERHPNIEIQLPLFSYKNMWVSHCPIHPQEIRERVGNLQGHLHYNKDLSKRAILDNGEVDKRYFNVNIDCNNYEFIKVEDIKRYFGV
jgi:calcineurin-like phosphoesterase family protein